MNLCSYSMALAFVSGGHGHPVLTVRATVPRPPPCKAALAAKALTLVGLGLRQSRCVRRAVATQFQQACRSGKEKTILNLLRSHPNQVKSLISRPVGQDRITAFSYISWFVLCEAMEEISETCEVPTEAVDHALSLVCRFGKVEALDILLKHFPEECRRSMPRDVAEACRKKRPQVAIRLLKAFPDVPLESDVVFKDQTTAFYWACRNGLGSVVRLMQALHPEQVSKALALKDLEGRTGLSYACQEGHDEVVKLLFGLLPEENESPKVAERTKSEDPMMVSKEDRQLLQQQGYKLVGSHSAVKQCRWTKSALLGEGQCYKHTFYGISSHRCMEGTPSLACANKCTFCWRGHANPVTTAWTYHTDDAKQVVSESIQRHSELVENVAASPRALPERLAEARRVGHMALSLVGEPVLYPEINALVSELHQRRISSFLVTNGDSGGTEVDDTSV